jgi:hypothetical protein
MSTAIWMNRAFAADVRAPAGLSVISRLHLRGLWTHQHNTAVRIVQALLDTDTCVLVAWLAWLWQPDERRKNINRDCGPGAGRD